MDVAITGSSGMIGAALVERLRSRGDEVRPVVRHSPAHGQEIGWDVDAGTIEAQKLDGVDAVVHLAGESIGERLRWNEAHKARVLESRVRGTFVLSEALASLERKPKVLVSASAIGYYGNRGEEELTEESSAGTGFLSRLCVEWEAATSPAERSGIRVVVPRIGLVLTGSGGLLGPLLPPFKLGLGGPIGSGRQWWSWVTLDDVIGAIVFCIENEVRGPVNVVAPNPVRQKHFARALGRALRRPAVIPLPPPAVKLALGAEAAREMVLTGSRISSAKLQAAGYAFEHPDLGGALRAVLR